MSETVDKVAASITEAMKAQPLPVALLVFNLAVLGFVYFSTQKNADRYEQQFDLLVQRCLPEKK